MKAPIREQMRAAAESIVARLRTSRESVSAADLQFLQSYIAMRDNRNAGNAGKRKPQRTGK